MKKNTLLELVDILDGKGPDKYWESHRNEDGHMYVDRSKFSDCVKVALNALEKIDTQYSNAVVLFGCFCARHCLPLFEAAYPPDNTPHQAIETIENYAKGQASLDDMAAAEETIDKLQKDMRGFGNDPEMSAIFAISSLLGVTRQNNIPFAAKSAALFAAGGFAGVASRQCADKAESVNAYNKAGHEALMVIADEFRRFCALEGEYGAIVG